MTETERIADELQRAYDGDAWHGPSLRAALEGVDARQAMARPLNGGHTLGELVLHITAWTREATRRLRWMRSPRRMPSCSRKLPGWKTGGSTSESATSATALSAAASHAR